MTGYLKPVTRTLYANHENMDSVIKVLVKQHRLKPDPDGNIEMLEEFWPTKCNQEVCLAPPLLVYAELLALMDPREHETAAIIREKCIDPTFDPGMTTRSISSSIFFVTLQPMHRPKRLTTCWSARQQEISC